MKPQVKLDHAELISINYELKVTKTSTSSYEALVVAKKYRETGLLAPLTMLDSGPLTVWKVLQSISTARGLNFGYLSYKPNGFCALLCRDPTRGSGGYVFAADANLALIRACLAMNVKPVFLLWSITESSGKRLVLKQILKRCHRIISNDSITQTQIINEFNIPQDTIKHVPFGTDTQFFRPDTVKKSRLELRILIPGDAHRDDKVVEVLLNQTNVTIVRLTKSERVYRHYEKLKKAFPQRIILRYKVSVGSMSTAYHGVDACLLPITKSNEPAGLTCLLEAMASGLPVLCNNRKTSTDYIQDGLTGFTYSSTDALIVLLQGLSGERCREMGAFARAQAQSVYDWNVVADSWSNGLFD